MIIRLRTIGISLSLAFMLVFLSGIVSAESVISEDGFDSYNSGAFPSFERDAGDRVGFNGVYDVKVENSDNFLEYAENESPLPEVIDISITNSGEVHEGESATISIIVVNNGDKSSEGYITVSLPNDEEILSVTGTGDGYNEIFPKGSAIPGKDGPISSSECPVVELQEFDWDSGQQEILTIVLMPNAGSDEVVFFLRAALKNDATGDYERIPIISDNVDQQGWFADKYFIYVIEPEPPIPVITGINIDPSDGVAEDGTSRIHITARNNGGKSSEGYITVSFPDDEEILSVTGTGGGYNEIYPKGSSVLGKDGPIPSSEDPIVELQEFDWGTGQEETLTVEVKPNAGSDEIVFFVRTALKNDAIEYYEWDPMFSDVIDQQGWYVYAHSIPVVNEDPDSLVVEILAPYANFVATKGIA